MCIVQFTMLSCAGLRTATGPSVTLRAISLRATCSLSPLTLAPHVFGCFHVWLRARRFNSEMRLPQQRGCVGRLSPTHGIIANGRWLNGKCVAKTFILWRVCMFVRSIRQTGLWLNIRLGYRRPALLQSRVHFSSTLCFIPCHAIETVPVCCSSTGAENSVCNRVEIFRRFTAC